MKMDGTVACWGSNDLVGQAEPPGGEFATVRIDVFQQLLEEVDEAREQEGMHDGEYDRA